MQRRGASAIVPIFAALLGVAGCYAKVRGQGTYIVVGSGACLDSKNRQGKFYQLSGGVVDRNVCQAACDVDPLCSGFDDRYTGCVLYRDLRIVRADGDTCCGGVKCYKRIRGGKGRQGATRNFATTQSSANLGSKPTRYAVRQDGELVPLPEGSEDWSVREDGSFGPVSEEMRARMQAAQRKLARGDPECIRAAAARHEKTGRVAIVLRGDAFRNWGSNGVNESCCNGSMWAQQRIAESHQHLIHVLEHEQKVSVDVFIASYPCSNGKTYVEDMLPVWYGANLKQLSIVARAAETQSTTMTRALQMVTRSDVQYDHMLVLRLDSAFLAFDACLLHVDRLLNGLALPIQDRTGKDRLHIVPARFRDCFIRHADNPGHLAEYADRVLSLAGTPVPSAGERLPDPCWNRVRYEKLSAADHWWINGTTTEAPSGDCACGSWAVEWRLKVLLDNRMLPKDSPCLERASDLVRSEYRRQLEL